MKQQRFIDIMLDAIGRQEREIKRDGIADSCCYILRSCEQRLESRFDLFFNKKGEAFNWGGRYFYFDERDTILATENRRNAFAIFMHVSLEEKLYLDY